jgi:hypothetical protein
MVIFILLVAFQLKHFLCDFPLQSNYMLGKFKGNYAWIAPLVSHSLMHGVFTGFIIIAINPKLVWLAGVDIFIHFTIDRIKVLYGGSDSKKPQFWWWLGADQMAHHLTHYGIIFLILKGGL